jgi:hypothetical protein
MTSEITDATEISLLEEAAALEARVKLLKEQALRKKIEKLKAEQAALEAELSSKPSLPIAASTAGPSSSTTVVAVPKASVLRTKSPGSTLSEEVVFGETSPARKREVSPSHFYPRKDESWNNAGWAEYKQEERKKKRPESEKPRMTPRERCSRRKRKEASLSPPREDQRGRTREELLENPARPSSS